MPKNQQKTPKSLPSEAEIEAPVASEASEEPEQSPEAAPEVEKTPLELLVEGIQVRRQMIAKTQDDFPPSTRPGLVAAQSEARDSLVVLERQYADYLKNSAVSAILHGDRGGVQKFLTLAQEISVEPLVVLAADEMYARLAKAALPGLGDSRQFGSGQVGLIIEEFAAIGKELFFTSLAAPNWQYDVVVPSFDDLTDVIRKAIRTSKDGDAVNRAFLRFGAFRKALDLGYTQAMVPVFIVNSTAGEVPFLSHDLFNASVVVNIKPGQSVTPDFVTSAFKAMVQAGKAFVATQRTQSVSL